MRSRMAVLAALVLLSACLGPRRDTSAFYLLSPTAAAGTAGATSPTIGIGPVSLPGYLDRPQIVVRLSDNQVTLSESDRWAEPLADNLVRTLEEDLGTLLPGTSFVRYPWYASEAPEYALRIDVRRFEADTTGAVVLDATWRLSRAGTPTGGSDVVITDQAAGAGQEAAVAALSRALGELSARVGAAIRSPGGR